MKIQYWAVIYPFQMDTASPYKPAIHTNAVEADSHAKVLTFFVDIPDDLFGTVCVEASLPEEIKNAT